MKITSSNGAPFYLALKEKVNNYFSNKKRTGNLKLFLKAAIIGILATFLYFFPIFVPISFGAYILIRFLSGWLMALSGFNIGHDAIHGSFSSKKWVNKIMGVISFDFAGVSSWYWNYKHDVIHHTYTNTEIDNDLNADKALRLAPWQKWYPIHKLQFFYAFFLYSLEHIHWALWNDFKRYRSNRIDSYEIPKKMSSQDRWVFWVGKVIYVVKSLVIPIVIFGLLKGILGYIAMELFCGLTISIVFQLAHVQNKSQFFRSDPLTGNVNEEWAVEQVKTTADFATNNPLITWQLGGLNFQTVHHLFSGISHVHYKSIQKIVIETCVEFKIQYNHYSTMAGALLDHGIYLWRMGRNPALTKLN